jgi:transglutaminase-like putative cysteine protease
MQWMTNKTRWMLFVSPLVLLAGVVVYLKSIHQPVGIASYPLHRTVKYNFTVRNPNSYLVKKSELWVYAPINESAFQQLASLTSNYPYSMVKDDKGNQRMMFVIENIPPYATRTITVTASLNLSDQGNRIESIRDEAYLSDEKLIGLTNTHIQRVAQSLKADKPKDTAHRIYKWITQNIKKSGYVRRDMGAPVALERKSGDCTEFMYLFSALARANSLPTRNMAGFVAKENRILKPEDYHNWNEAYIDGEWYLIDTDKQVFMEKSSDYIAMRSIEDSTQDRDVESQSFFSSSADIQVSMN